MGAIQAARAEAEARFEAMGGAPKRRDEYWRYTNPAPLAAAGLARAEAPSPFAGGALIALTHGRAAVSDAAAGLEICALEAAPWAAELYGRIEKLGQFRAPRPLAAANTAWAAGQALAIRATGAERLRIHHAEADAATQARLLIDVAPGASLAIFESGVTAGVSVIEARLGEGARLEHVRLQTEQPGERAGAAYLFADLAGGADLRSVSLTMDGKLTRNETFVKLSGAKAQAHLAAAMIGRGSSHLDSTMFVWHDAPGCESRQIVKAALDGQARGVFQGKIYVSPVAQKTDGYQISQSLLLSENAEFNAKPELEIYADDVKCSHGSTSGALDETSLFYMKARGIPQREAEALLTAAFVEAAIVEAQDEEAQEILRGRVERWMADR